MATSPFNWLSNLYDIEKILSSIQTRINTLGQTVSINSYPVTIASDQSAVSNNPIGVSTAVVTVSANITTASVTVIAANVNRKGLVLYNNSANSVYLSFSSTANSSSSVTYILATFASLTLPAPIYTGKITGIRNAGSGTVICTELT